MPSTFTTVTELIEAALGRVFPAAQVEVRHRNQTIFSGSYGWLDPLAWPPACPGRQARGQAETRQYPTRPDTLFDLASVTKLFVVTAFMGLVEEGKIGLDQPVSTLLPEFCGLRPIQPYEDPLRPGTYVTVDSGQPASAPQTVDAGRVTFRNLLAHNSGLPAWRPLYKEGNPEAARRLALTTYFSYPIGVRTIYSDIGLILLGMSVERLTGQPLDEAVRQRVTEPLQILGIRYFRVEDQLAGAPAEHPNHDQYLIPNTQDPIPNIAPTEFCAWRGRRIVGEVHDENTYRLGGVAGHAGLFSSAHDLATFGQSFLVTGQYPIPNTQHLLCPATIAEMTRLQAQDGVVRRGLGFALWSPDPEASGNPFSRAAFGHTGFTGTSLWIDPERSLVVAVCTNRVYYGRDASGILEFRLRLHRAIVEQVTSP